MTLRRYGWVRDLPDRRDFRFAISRPVPLPTRADLRDNFPGIYDQGELNSCTGNACAAALAYARNMEGLVTLAPSRLQLYYNARALEGTAGSDSGAQIRDVIKAAAREGACDEGLWPYDPSRVLIAPDAAARSAALKDCAIGYHRVTQNPTDIRSCIADGDPIVFGFTVYDSFESDAMAASGIMSMPGANEAVVGGHAVVACGYDDSTNFLIVRNSWGYHWGLAGYFMMPYSYAFDSDLASDFWTIRLVTP